ncbi:isoaspartyl peptidase/L-asparaginase family protein [Mesohalobacter halotolerans]|uniref:Isoaspartyl peptidase n=1 Tax=Mesohalobacter halotolerans TaxID=1883405 RepID=A0A4U5TT40_9FLAO|nr:isoaspartyl peptidase/L-asparaginase [Mesohalobacter halotolerans]MBS3737585.1 isoaspartyl peptidase/L-asparaginase [Psychroflexus sp.]TKS57293.1 isoaspartyl peptidase/L-asparaginase [Mesohalobacter halotolerans]
MNKTFILYTILGFFFLACQNQPQASKTENNNPEKIKKENPIAIVIHGGAGYMAQSNMNEEKQNAYKAKLDEAVSKGHDILNKGGTAIEAVQRTINILEDSPLFNSGKGAVFNHEGYNELDASIMDGKTLNAGAVAGVTNVKNPINLAYEVMENSKHVMLSGAGAQVFAKERGITLVDSAYFAVPDRLEALKRAQNKTALLNWEDEKFGTVGCVALDQNGNIAAGTSTGGMTNKCWNRIGDSPIIGAGTYANNATCGVSSTGHGEYFIRLAVAHDISAQMEYQNKSLQQAAEEVVMKKLKNLGGDGGIIALDKDGNISMVFNTSGMFRASIDPKGQKQIKIFK